MIEDTNSSNRMTEVELECAVYGEGTVFPVKIAWNAKVSALQEKIAGVLSTKQHTVPPRLVALYVARKKGGPWLKCDASFMAHLKRARHDDSDYAEMLPNWTLDDEECIGEDFQPGYKDIHVLVVPPVFGHSEFCDHGWTARWLSVLRTSEIAPQDLPLVGELPEFIDQALPTKITIPERVYGQWITKMSSSDPELMAKLFRVDNVEPCLDFLNAIGHRVVQPAVRPGHTENSFISFWDTLIRNVLDFVAIGTSYRSSSRSRSLGPSCPDYLYLVDSVCVFRGEERAPGASMVTPRDALSDKLRCSYGNAPYLLGYAAVGYEARLYAISRAQDRVITVELGAYDLDSVRGRLRLLLAILNMARLFRSLASLCPHIARNEYGIRNEQVGSTKRQWRK